MLKTPNAETLSAMKELEDGGGQVFQSVEELFADWKDNACDQEG